ncbi:hypothetical protein, partial [Priestia sp. TGN 0903]|uniref:hypothetical protein n=1 Tax=Priestia sp. TGN 0903 TaxID=3420730 RepID=UPI003D7817AE
MTWTCSTCDATIAGSRAEHCGAKGLACFALWPAVATPDLNAAAFEKAPDGRWVSTQDPSDPLSPIAKLVEPLGLIPVDPD